MEKSIELHKIRPTKKWRARSALKKIAGYLARASKTSEKVGDDVLYHLPGVFSLGVSYGGESVRLIKEANSFRIMKSSEKSDVSLIATVVDAAAIRDICTHKASWQKLYAEGRVTFAGKIKYATLFMRVMAEGDKAFLPAKKYQELYGE